jgi:hypothetical protein
MHFLVFVPLTTDAHALEAVGLEEIASGAMSTTIDVGPDGRPGTMFGWPRDFRPPVLTVSEEQIWLPACAAPGFDPDRYSVAISQSAPPTPGDLLRPRNFGGNVVALGDGYEWQIPNCRDLPHAWQTDEDGRWRLKAKREYRDLIVEAADKERRFRPGGEGVEPQEGLDFAFRALSINYRLTREVASYLELFTGGNEGTLRACFELCVGAGEES